MIFLTNRKDRKDCIGKLFHVISAALSETLMSSNWCKLQGTVKRQVILHCYVRTVFLFELLNEAKVCQIDLLVMHTEVIRLDVSMQVSNDVDRFNCLVHIQSHSLNLTVSLVKRDTFYVFLQWLLQVLKDEEPSSLDCIMQYVLWDVRYQLGVLFHEETLRQYVSLVFGIKLYCNWSVVVLCINVLADFTLASLT